MKVLIFLLFLFTVWTTFSEQTENVDLYVILDKSKSMDNKIGAVKDYLINTIIERGLSPQDTLTLIVFYGKAETIVSLKIIQAGEKQVIKERISGIEADGTFTDIGNALDCLKDVLTSQPDTGKRKQCILITDGKHEAPKGSKYYSPDGKFNHEFLKITKTIRQQGWKIEILFIGKKDENTERIFDLLPGTIYTFPENVTEQELAIKTEDMFRLFNLQAKPGMEPIPSDGSTILKLDIISKETKDPVAITIKKIQLTTQNKKQENLLSSNYPFIAHPNTTTQVDIPVILNLNLHMGKYEGELSFYFSGSAAFIPAISDIDFQVIGEPGMLWQIELQGKPVMEPIPPSGKSRLKLAILSKETRDPVAIMIYKIRLKTQNQEQENLISSNYPFIAQPNTITHVNIPVTTDLNLDKGKYNGEFSFYFSGNAAFTPAISDIDFKVIGEPGIIWLIIIISVIIVLAFLVFLIILMRKYKKITPDTDNTLKQDVPEKVDKPINKEIFNVSKNASKVFATGMKDNFFILHTGMDLEEDPNGHPSYDAKKKTIACINKYLHKHLKAIPKKIPIPKEEICVTVFLFPDNESDCNELMKCVFNLFLYKEIFAMEDCLQDYILSLKLCLHYGGIKYYSRVDKIASWDVSYTFKFGAEIKKDGIFQPDYIYITEDAEKFIPSKIKQYMKETEKFREKKIYRIGFAAPIK